MNASRSTLCAVELGVAGAIDLAHAAFADEGGHVVVPEPGTDFKGHQLVYRAVGRSDSAIVTTAGRRLHRLHGMALRAVQTPLSEKCVPGQAEEPATVSKCRRERLHASD